MKRTASPDGRVFSDVGFLFERAREWEAGVIVHTVLTALATTLLNMAQWLALPTVLYAIETSASLSTVMWLVVCWAVLFIALRFMSCYEEGAFSQSRDRFRTRGSTRLVRKALTLSYPQATDAAHLKELTRASQAMGKHIEAPIPHMWKTFSNLLINTIALVVYTVVLCRLHAGLWCVTTVTAVLGALVHRFVSDWGHRHQGEEAQCDAQLAYVAHAAGSAHLSKDIRVFGLAPWLKAICDSGMRAAQAFVRRRAKVYALYNLAEALLILLANGIAYLVLIHMTVASAIPVSLCLLYVSAVGGLTWAVRGVAADLLTTERACLELAAYRRFLEQEDLFVTDGGVCPTRGGLHTIELCDVSFTYPDADKPTLEHLSFTWHPGEKLAVVGQDGIGKSTLAKLLCGLYDPSEGTVRIDGVDVRALDRRAYYALFSTVFQEEALPDMTVAELVTQMSDPDEERLWDCLEKAGIAKTVCRLPHGEHTHIGRAAFEDGVELSGGQTRRLLLARALYKNGDLLILDEPTAALDPLAENALYREYDRMTRGKGAVFMSHRLASTRFCDRILYLKNGSVCEEGTHEELMKRGGEYAHLYALQSRYYREGRHPER